MKVTLRVKNAKLQTYKIKYESLKVHDDKIIARFFLRVDNIINTMRGLGDKIESFAIIEYILRSLTPNFDAKISAIEEIRDLKRITLELIHGILIAYVMRKGNTSEIRYSTFKPTYKWKEKEVHKDTIYISDEEEENFVRKLQVGNGNYAHKCPYKENHDKEEK